MQNILYNLGLGEGAGAMALWLGLGIILLIVVISFGTWLLRTLRPSLNMGGQGRAGRPQRLAITDAFNLDRDGRKLVIIRRDNVEHLLLIGGTNDVVIETSIIKGERSSRTRQAEMDPPTISDPVVAEAPRVLEPMRPQATTAITAPPAPISAPMPATGAAPSVTLGGAMKAGSIPSSVNAPNQPSQNQSPQNQAGQIRIPATLVPQPPIMPSPTPARPVESLVATREGGGAQQSAPIPVPAAKTSPAPLQQAMRPAPAPPMAENVQKAASPAAPNAARSFEDEFERAMSVSKPPAPQPLITPAQQAAPKPGNNPAPASAPRAEPASEMAKRLNEVLQRPMANAARAQPGVNAPSLPPLAENPGSSPPQAQDMDLLEEEMARLLGRVGAPPGKS